MSARSRLLTALVLVVGGLVSYAAATGSFAPFSPQKGDEGAKAPEPGSPGATRTIDGKQLPPPDL